MKLAYQQVPLIACAVSVVAAVLFSWTPVADACCPASPADVPVVNADQTVLVIWDERTGTQHFIRRASFKGDAKDFGFIVPSPSQPVLAESHDEAFELLQTVTKPDVVRSGGGSRGIPCGCGAPYPAAAAGEVRVVESKRVAGYDATVLEATTPEALTNWLGQNGYSYSAEVREWARPYVEQRWKFTALRLAAPSPTTRPDASSADPLTTPALRISFKTSRPLFPYREPDPGKAAAAVGARSRLLRIYFVGNARMEGLLTPEHKWTGRIVWAGELTPNVTSWLTVASGLSDADVPLNRYLTEFEDNWPYESAPADLYFAPAADQSPVKRPTIYVRGQPSFPAGGTAMAAIVATAGLGIMTLRRRR